MNYKQPTWNLWRSFSSVICASLVVCMFLPAVARAATVRIYLNPASGSAMVGGNLSVQIRISKDASTSLEIVQADLTFPANLLNVTNVNSVGSNYNQSNSLTSSWSNSAGTIHVKGHNTSIPSTGDFLVANITFSAKAAGTAQVKFASTTQAGRMNNNGNVAINKIDVMSSGQYVVTAAPASNPTTPPPATPSNPTTQPSTPVPTPAGSTGTTPENTSTSSGPANPSTSDTPSTDSANDTTAAPTQQSKKTTSSQKPSMLLVSSGVGIAFLLAAGVFIWLARRRHKPIELTSYEPMEVGAAVVGGMGLEPEQSQLGPTAEDPALAAAIPFNQPLEPLPEAANGLPEQSPAEPMAAPEPVLPAETVTAPEPLPEPEPQPLDPPQEENIATHMSDQYAAALAANPLPDENVSDRTPADPEPAEQAAEPASDTSSEEPSRTPLSAPKPSPNMYHSYDPPTPETELNSAPIPEPEPSPQQEVLLGIQQAQQAYGVAPALVVAPTPPPGSEPLDMFEAGEQRLATEEANHQIPADSVTRTANDKLSSMLSQTRHL